ncbi:pyrroline-5-carboxylate reductase [Halobacteriovorax marinus]|uniref:Pyrroline-5-carboxylate reductase n=1 Tax=Halobacteriovorax marinus TaxID=97084 RepID=A0A1Y5F9N6_9BACT|nr:pyrroline-5-carboxylate reductase [Halobacteriovorax marinus]
MKSLLSFGCGNMARAIIEGLYNKQAELSYTLYTPSQKRAIELAGVVNGVVLETLLEVPKCDYYMLSCKPQQLKELASEIKGKLNPDAVVISILAGSTVATIQDLLGVTKVLRIMPNTPALVGAGVNAFYFSDEVSASEREHLVKLFDSFSKVFVFETEDEIDKITGFSGSGPAYIFEFSRILIQKMVDMGIGADVASEMVKWTVFGASKLQLESNEGPETLRNNVTSKKGVTYEALEVFKSENMQLMVEKAIDAAYNRSKELSKNS